MTAIQKGVHEPKVFSEFTFSEAAPTELPKHLLKALASIKKWFGNLVQ